MKLREKVVVEGLPYVWSTNLPDDDVREFYELYANQIREPDPAEETPTKGKVVFRIPCRVAFLEFRDGVCLWTASADKHHVLYRTNQECELWSARQQEKTGQKLVLKAG